ncbi:MAG: hypothetical protein LLG01_07985 [Planctomycetaceae bacterium]|nr:hypothetical protein [Planctomycetaceae bacterium]
MIRRLLNHPHPLVRKIVHYGRVPLGVFLILLGIAGLFLPVLQGWLTIFAGIVVLAPDSRLAKTIRRRLQRLRARWRLWRTRRRLARIRGRAERDKASGGQ